MTSYTFLRIEQDRVPVQITSQIVNDGRESYREYELRVRNTIFRGKDLQELVEEAQDFVTGVLI